MCKMTSKSKKKCNAKKKNMPAEVHNYSAEVSAHLNFQSAPRNGGGPGPAAGPSAAEVSPSRGPGATPGAGTSAIDQRALAARRNPMEMALAQPTHPVSGNFARHNTSGDRSILPLLELNDFPSLRARGAGNRSLVAAPPQPSSKPYVGMVKQATLEQAEFTMSAEHFPALPGTSPGKAAPAPVVSRATRNAEELARGIMTSPDGTVTNIPATMIPNQFGVAGLLTYIRAAESNPGLVALALGEETTAMGLNLNSPDNLYPTFGGPWAGKPCRPQDLDYNVPPEYLVNGAIREKLAPLRLTRYKEDLLFYLFYCFVGDALQIAAASELYNREWRYHMEEKVWISQVPGIPVVEKTPTYERGTYFYFDAHTWCKVTREFRLDYSKLEGRPQPPLRPAPRVRVA